MTEGGDGLGHRADPIMRRVPIACLRSLAGI